MLQLTGEYGSAFFQPTEMCKRYMYVPRAYVPRTYLFLIPFLGSRSAFSVKLQWIESRMKRVIMFMQLCKNLLIYQRNQEKK